MNNTHLCSYVRYVKSMGKQYKSMLKDITLAEEAFPNQQGPAIQRQLIDIFLDGLSEDYLKMKILRDNPNNLDAAIIAATNDQNVRTRFSLKTHHPVMSQEEPMDISHYRPMPRCFKCNKKVIRLTIVK